MPVKSSLKDKLEDDVLDLSLMQLDQIPVKDIAPLTKGTSLDLSNNLLTYVPESFSTLTHLVKLDLSKNQITELPEYFGNLQNLRHLDLYSNKLERLPVSFAQLKNLKWLDLKKNPLVPALRQAAGPCITNLECTACAKKVVALLQSLQSQLENEKKLWVMEEKKNLQRRLETEEAERERIKAEKKAASAKRRKENMNKDNGEKKVKPKSGSPNSSFEKESASQTKFSRKGNTSVDDGNQIGSSKSFSWIFFLGMLYFLTILGAVGASALWLYTDGNLNQKSILLALPLMQQDFVSAYNMALEKALTAGSDFTNWSSKAMGDAGVSLQSAWKEFMRRNDVLAQYVNVHYGPYFCYCKKSLYLQWQNLQSFLSHFVTNTMRPLLHDVQSAVWPYVEQVVEFVMDKSRGFVSFLSSAME